MTLCLLRLSAKQELSLAELPLKILKQRLSQELHLLQKSQRHLSQQLRLAALKTHPQKIKEFFQDWAPNSSKWKCWQLLWATLTRSRTLRTESRKFSKMSFQMEVNQSREGNRFVIEQLQPSNSTYISLKRVETPFMSNLIQSWSQTRFLRVKLVKCLMSS